MRFELEAMDDRVGDCPSRGRANRSSLSRGRRVIHPCGMDRWDAGGEERLALPDQRELSPTGFILSPQQWDRHPDNDFCSRQWPAGEEQTNNWPTVTHKERTPSRRS